MAWKTSKNAETLKDLVVSVISLGAKGDGVTDDTSVIQKAIDDVSQLGGGTVFFPKGTYIISPLFMKPNVTLLGAGIDVAIIRLANNAPEVGTNVRMINMHDNTAILNLTCNGNSEAHPSGSEHMHCIFIYDRANILIDGCKLTNARGDGISITGSTIKSKNVTIQNCYISNNNRSEIVVEQVDHLKILNNYIDGIHTCIHFEPFEHVGLYDCVITGNTLKTPYDSYVVALRGDGDNADANYNNITFSDNYIDAPNAHLLLGWVKNVNITGNHFKSIREIYAWYYTEKVNISNNFINSASGIKISAEGTQWSTDYIINGNTITSNGVGVYLKGIENAKVINNKLIGTVVEDGIYVWATKDTKNIDVKGNEVIGFLYGLRTDTYGTSTINQLNITDNAFNTPLSFKGKLEGIRIKGNAFLGDGTKDAITFFSAFTQSNVDVINNYFNNWKRAFFASNYSTFYLSNVYITHNHITGMTGVVNGGETGAPIEFRKFQNAPVDVTLGTNHIKHFLAQEPITLDGSAGGGLFVENAKDKGALGDGLADDTAVIQAVIDKLRDSGGGTLYFPKGTYLIQKINLWANVNLVGAGRDVSTLKLFSGTPDDGTVTRMVYMYNNTSLKYLTVDGDYTNSGTRVNDIIVVHMNYSNDTTVEHCKIISANSHAIEVKGTVNNAQILNNKITGATTEVGVNIWGTDPTQNVRIIKNEFSGLAKGINVSTYSTGSVSNVYVEDNTFNNVICEIRGLVTRFSFDNNQFFGDGTTTAVYFQQTADQKDISITNNYAKNWNRVFYFRASSTYKVSNVLITNNILTDLTGVTVSAETHAPIEFYRYETQPVGVTIGLNIIRNYAAVTPITLDSPYNLSGQLDGVGIYSTVGSPEGVLNARLGSICLDKTNGKMYVKETGAGLTNTGWVMK